MKRGGCLHAARIAYERWGRPNAAGDNVILILPGLSPNAHAAAHAQDPTPGWWEAMLGPGQADRHQSLARHLRQFAWKLPWVDGARLAKSGNRKAIWTRLPGSFHRGHR